MNEKSDECFDELRHSCRRDEIEFVADYETEDE
jgi:hypothetical protein